MHVYWLLVRVHGLLEARLLVRRDEAEDAPKLPAKGVSLPWLGGYVPTGGVPTVYTCARAGDGAHDAWRGWEGDGARGRRGRGGRVAAQAQGRAHCAAARRAHTAAAATAAVFTCAAGGALCVVLYSMRGGLGGLGGLGGPGGPGGLGGP
eukprot:scaffold69251_cov71-Phaeocystis_antarctica.AAC.3